MRSGGDSAYRSGRSPDSLKMKNPACEAVRREAEEALGRVTRLEPSFRPRC